MKVTLLTYCSYKAPGAFVDQSIRYFPCNGGSVGIGGSVLAPVVETVEIGALCAFAHYP